MAAPALRRVALMVPLLFGLSVVTFLYVHAIPGDPVTAMLGVNANPPLVAQLRQRFGLDQPVLVQYGHWLSNIVHGNLGVSFQSQLPIGPIITAHLTPTIQLAIGGLIFMMILAIPAGVIAGLRPGSRMDQIVTSMTLVGLGLPAFWLGTIILLLVGLKWRLFPSQGFIPFFDNPAQSLRLSIMPWVVLGLAISPYLARLTRTAVVEVVQQPSISFAQAKGLSELSITRRYILRNTWSPMTAAIALTVGGLMGGSVVIESLFNWPGMGQLLVTSIDGRDYAMVQALVLIYGTLFLVVNLAAELIQAMLDPRVRLT
jgi:peptide/nickel transport system permease protein